MSSRRDPRKPTRRALLGGGAALAAASCAGTRSAAPAPDPVRRRIDEGLASLSDQKGTVAPISADERAVRRKRLGGILADRGVDALLMEGGPTMSYLAGVQWGRSERFFGLVALADGTHFWICPAFEESRARAQIDPSGPYPGPGGAVVAWQEDEYPDRPLARALLEHGVKRLAFEPALRFTFAERFAASLGRDRVDAASGAPIVVALRSRKDAHEIAILRRANELTELAVQAAARCLAPGMTGAQVGSAVEAAHRRLGFTGSWNLSLIGPAAALPHGSPDERPLERGSVLLVDSGGEFHGYQSDQTRTWIFDGKPTAEVERAWNAVRDAQLAAFEAIRPGVVCGDVDRAARAKLVERGFRAGYADFTHRLGHGIGVEGHEDPYFDGGSTVKLESGMTLSDEPGVYFPGRFGVRLEDVVLVTDSGADHFGSWQRSPVSPE
jgi:Xaa-Pro dipeptidase